MRVRAAFWALQAALTWVGCVQSESAPSRERAPEAEPANKPDTTPGSSFNVTPAGHAAGASGQGGTAGKPASGGTSGANTAPLGGATSGGRAATGAGAAGSSVGTGAAGALDDCTSPTRVRSNTGACVDRVTTFSVGGAPAGIVAGSDGSLWFDDTRDSELVQLGFDGRVSSRVTYSAADTRRELISGDGSAILWFTDPNGRAISRLNRSVDVTVFELGIEVAGLALERDNTVWVTEPNQAVYRLTLEDPPDVQRVAAAPRGKIVIGPDQRPWFVTANGVGRVTDASVDEFVTAGAHVSDLCSGPEASLWFSDDLGGRIGRIDTNGRTTFLPRPSGSEPQRVVAGPDGALWFTERGRGVIGRMSVNGDVSYYPLASGDTQPDAIAVGADGNIWFTLFQAGRVGRLTPDS